MSRTLELEALLDALGFAARVSRDEGSTAPVDPPAARFEEVAVFARRGWVESLTAETDVEYSAREYARVLGRLLRPLGIERVMFDDELGVVTVDQERYQTELPVHDNQRLDLAWLLDMANLVASAGGHVLATVTESPDVFVALVPRTAWSAIVERQLEGEWSAMAPVVPAFN